MAKNVLTTFEEAFAQKYARNPDATAAFRASGYSFKNMKPETQWQQASKILNRPKVSARIKELQDISKKVASKKFEIDSEEIIRHLDILRKARIDEYVEYKTVEIPVTRHTTVTTGTGKNKVSTTNTETFIKEEVQFVFKPWDDLTDEQKMAIESVKHGRYGIELKLHGKHWSIDMLNKHLGLYEKDNRQKTTEINNEIDMSKMSTETLQAIAEAYVKPDII